MDSIHQRFSDQFYKWELRGRGWQIFPEPVHPEPPFVPFNGHYLPEGPIIDDGVSPSFLGSLFRKIVPKPAVPPPPEPEEEPEPKPLIREDLIELQTSLPADLDIKRESFEQFLSQLSLCEEPVVFELVGTHKKVLAQFVTGSEDAALVRKQLQAHFPDVSFRSQAGGLEKAWDDSEGDHALAVEFGLEKEFMLPLAVGKQDPFIGIIGALGELKPGEMGVFQVLFQPVQNEWAESIVNSVTDAEGTPFFVNQPELAGAAEKKVALPLYAAVVRILTRSVTNVRAYEIARDLAGSLRVFAHPQGNALIPLHNDDYPFEEHIMDVLARQCRRSGMILTSDELTGFVHLPSSAVRTTALLRDTGKTKAAPAIVSQPPGIIIGDNEHEGKVIPVYLTTDQRIRHTHIVGTSGTGKSSLLFNLIRQDIENGAGVGVLDPHGDLIDQILSIIPDDRINDVVLVDPSDIDFPIGFNILQAHSEDEKSLLASDLVSVFRRLATSWGDQMDTVLQNAILAILESSRGGTLADLRRFLLEPAFRADFLKSVQEPELLYYWQKVFPELGGGKSVGSILTRLQDFFSRKPLRNMVSQRENRLDFADIMDSGKIFLAKLSEGHGAENSYLLGTLMVGKFQQLAMARQSQEESKRRPFWLYIDEFDHFISPSMAAILKGTRKYRLGLTLAHQSLHQLQQDPAVASSVMANPCTRIVLRVSDDDAKKLGEGFSFFDNKSLVTLEKFHAITRVERNDFDFNLALRKPDLTITSSDKKEAVIAASRARYATPRAPVEAALLAALQNDGKAAVPSAQPPIAETQKTPVPPKETLSAFTGSETKDMSVVLPAPIPPAGVPQPAISPNVEVPKDLPKGVPPSNSSTGAEEESQHEKIKRQITTEAEGLDFTVTAEQNISPHGRPDLVLARGGLSVACEISDTTPAEAEADHIRLRLQAGFKQVAVISVNRRKLAAIQAAYEKQGPGDERAGVRFYTPREFFNQLLAWAGDDPDGGRTERGKPKKRTFDFGASAPADRQAEERQNLDALAAMMAKNRKC